MHPATPSPGAAILAAPSKALQPPDQHSATRQTRDDLRVAAPPPSRVPGQQEIEKRMWVVEGHRCFRKTAKADVLDSLGGRERKCQLAEGNYIYRITLGWRWARHGEAHI